MGKSHSIQVQELPRDLTPDRLPLSLFESPYFFLLDSSTGGRYSIAAFDPLLVFEAEDDMTNPFQFLQDDLRGRPFINESDLPFAGGWIGYFGYELYSLLEKKVPTRQPDLIPKAVFGFYDRFYLYDHLEKRGQFVTVASKEGKPLRFLRDSSHHLGRGRRSRGPRTPAPSGNKLFNNWLRQTGPRNLRGYPPCSIHSNFTKAQYLAAIHKIKNYINSGDCYQVNLSQRFSCPISESPAPLYQRLRKVSPAPYSAFLNLGDAQILSSSPECFLEVNGREVLTRPIKGTRARGKGPQEDTRLQRELEGSLKDHSELLMITDLERNDLGRVCRAGSVTVPELHRMESFSQVHHLVATIRGTLAEGKDVTDLLKATFPGGSITGAPKIRAMQIIQELEDVPRNVYCGSIGYLSLNGKAQFNIAIRTMILKNRRATFSAGGGIVADSDPEAEYEETLTKAKGMFETLDLDPESRDDLSHVGMEKLWEKESSNQSRQQEHVVNPDRVEIAQHENHSE